MRKSLAVAVLSVGLLLNGLAVGTAIASRSSGRSFSSGRSSSFSSSGRSYSSGSSSSGRSYSNSGSLSGRSYSSRPSSSPAASSINRPSTRPSPNKPVAGSTSRTSTKSYSSGSRPTSSAIPLERRYSSGNPSLSGKSYATGSSASDRPSAGSFDAAAARSQRMAESRVAYLKGQQPKASYTDGGGVSHPIPSGDREIESLRRELDRRRWENRALRRRTFFGRYYADTPPVIVYHDPYSNFFWWWLLNRSLDEQAYWAYNHRQSMDGARYRDLLAHDANLEARIRQLEAQHAPPDPTYRPDSIDPDLMYSNSYIEAVYNPQPRVTAPLRAMVTVLIVVCVLGLIIWLVFYKRWGGIGG